MDSSSSETYPCTFFDNVKTLPGDWLTSESRRSGLAQKPLNRRKYWDDRVRSMNSRAHVKRSGGGAATSLSHVPYQAATVTDAKLNHLGKLFGISELLPPPAKPEPTFYVTLQLMKSRVKVRAESPSVRRERQYAALPSPRKSMSFVRPDGSVVSLNEIAAMSPDSELLNLQPLTGSSMRGEITHLSEKSRARLSEFAHELTACGELPKFMLTLTYPGDWRSVASNGRSVKRHLNAMRKRLVRYFERLGMGFSLLWFLEFQKRGAPHVHLILWGADLTLSDEGVRVAQKQLPKLWAEVVAHADPVHRERHLRRGTGFARMRKPHFGYAAKYARKMQQKAVPPDFSDVGRFWGYWNYKKPAPYAFSMQLSYQQLQALSEALMMSIYKKSLSFANRIGSLITPTYQSQFDGPPKIGEVNGSCTVFGSDAVEAVGNWIGAGFVYKLSPTI